MIDPIWSQKFQYYPKSTIMSQSELLNSITHK